MADVRSLLRQERAARQQAKPPKRSAAPAAAPASKKRKATDDHVEERKRTRTEEAAGVPAGFFDPQDENEELGASTEDVTLPKDNNEGSHPGAELPVPDTQTTKAPPDAADDPDLDAFLAEMDQAVHDQRESVKQYSNAVIEAAPMTAAELAAQAREEMSAQRARRDEEMEGEKEDAARALEDEFDEMEGLEERMKRLREQREALRSKRVAAETSLVPDPAPQQDPEESDSDDGWDDWNFGSA